MDDDAMGRLVHEPLDRVAKHCESPIAQGVLARVQAACESSLGGEVLPLVRTHGDFTDSNCLFDRDGRLAAVVDWEVSLAQGFPLMDLLQLMPVAGETGTHPRWQRFDVWRELLLEPARVLRDPVMGAYVRAMGIPPAAVPGLVLAQWATHVADRIAARCDDRRWMRLRVWQPIEVLGRTLRG
jgi:hypothetical protein